MQQHPNAIWNTFAPSIQHARRISDMKPSIILDKVEPYRKKWRLSKRTLETGFNFQRKDKISNTTHTIISIYYKEVDNPGSFEIAFKEEGIAAIFNKPRRQVQSWIDYAETEIGKFANRKTSEQYRRISISTPERFDRFLVEFDQLLTEASPQLSSPKQSVERPVVDERILSEILTRRGQKEFRDSLMRVYHGRCAITGCQAEEALEAAHIIPHAQEQSYAITNGILLRVDIHTLFDLLLISINPSSGQVCVAESIMSCYSALDGIQASLPSTEYLDPRALQNHYIKWQQLNELTFG